MAPYVQHGNWRLRRNPVGFAEYITVQDRFTSYKNLVVSEIRQLKLQAIVGKTAKHLANPL